MPGTRTTTSEPMRVRTAGGRRDGARHGRARAALGDGDDALAPAFLSGHVELRAHDDDGGAAAHVDAELLGARDDLIGRDGATPEEVVQELGDGQLGGAGGRAQALHLGGDEREDQPQDHRRRRVAVGAPTHPQLADLLVGDTEVVDLDPGGVAQQPALVGGRPCRHGKHRAGPVGQRQARVVERASGRADHLGEARTGLDGVGDGIQGLEVDSGRRPRSRAGHGAEFTAPNQFAASLHAKSHRSGRLGAGLGGTGSLDADAVPEPDDRRSARDADADERGQDVHAEDGGGHALPDPRVRRPGGDQDERHVGGEGEDGAARPDEIGDLGVAHARRPFCRRWTTTSPTMPATAKIAAARPAPPTTSDR